MAEKITFDTENKLIVCNAGVTELDVKADLYSDAKENWRADSALNKFRFPFRVIGGDETVPPEKAPLFAYLRYGWRLRPQEASHTLRLKNGTILVDEDPSVDPIVPTEGDYNVMVRDVVPIRGTQIETGGSGLTQEEHNKLMSVAIEDGGRLEDIDDTSLAILSDTEFIKDVEGGKWEISGNQMIFYKSDNTTEIARFDITEDEAGNPMMRTRA